MLRVNFVFHCVQCAAVSVVATHATCSTKLYNIFSRAAGLVPFVSAPRVGLCALLLPHSDIFRPRNVRAASVRLCRIAVSLFLQTFLVINSSS
jgi:hypothetical protein